jgi:hypothetical protein
VHEIAGSARSAALLNVPLDTISEWHKEGQALRIRLDSGGLAKLVADARGAV